MRWSLVALAALAIAGGYAVSRGVGAQTGVRPDGRVLAPIMPWRAYAGLTKSDIGAIVEYLGTLPAISHQVPGPFGLDEKPAIFRMTILPPEKASRHD